GWFSDLNLVKKKHIYQAATFASAVVYNLVPFFTQYASLAVIFGMCSFFNGAVVVLAPVLLAEELGLVNLPITSGVMYRFV
ncbi:hypothetical protein QQ73_08335, partial [Candidatus Endoriftia persephone str. Guaymas]|nr:hypothetical protein [Candidatus Endoriftia persephone str. Guaymas]